MKVEYTHQLTQDVTIQGIVPLDQPTVHHTSEVADAIYTYLQRHGDILIVFIYFYTIFIFSTIVVVFIGISLIGDAIVPSITLSTASSQCDMAIEYPPSILLVTSVPPDSLP